MEDKQNKFVVLVAPESSLGDTYANLISPDRKFHKDSHLFLITENQINDAALLGEMLQSYLRSYGKAK